MELVLSPGGGAGDAGSPFRNEDVREWSRVDRITGMLEQARVETDRWQADTRDAKQSYGKVRLIIFFCIYFFFILLRIALIVHCCNARCDFFFF